jgi:hypothetical protein
MKNKKSENKTAFLFSRRNYINLLIGLGLTALGFLLMVGGKSDDPNVFNEAVFSHRRITLAPILIIAGYVMQIVAIMHRPKALRESDKETEENTQE